MVKCIRIDEHAKLLNASINNNSRTSYYKINHMEVKTKRKIDNKTFYRVSSLLLCVRPIL